MKKIGVDIDQVLADTLDTYIQFHNHKHSTNFKADDIRSLEWWNEFGISEDQFVQDYYEFGSTGFADRIKPVTGSQEAVTKLKLTHDLVAITARPSSIADNTRAWLDNNFPGVFKEIHFSREKVLAKAEVPKQEICRRIGAKVLIDDSFEYALECAANNIEVLLFDWPWNRGRLLPETVTRVHNWGEVLDHLE